VSLFSVRPPRLSKADTLAAAILLNECYSLSLKRSLDCLNSIYGYLPSIFFKVDDRRKAQPGILREGSLIHLQKGSRGPALGRSHGVNKFC
jgi:hypothetical protein